MKAVEFEGYNHYYAKSQPEYFSLPAYKDGSGLVVMLYKPTWKERLKILFRGQIWVSIKTFNKPLQPQRIGVERPPEIS